MMIIIMLITILSWLCIILLYKIVMMLCSDICGDAAGYIWPPIYQSVLVRGAASAPNQVNRELFTTGGSIPISHLLPVRTAQVARRLTEHDPRLEL